ncbi:MAG: DUF4337 domain-containing protein, partial [Abditibacteriaceae bacterium]
MSYDEMKELHEHAEHAKVDPGMAPITLTMAILAVVVASVSMLGHRAHTKEVIIQGRITNQWAWYQAAGIKADTAKLLWDLTSVENLKDSKQTTKLRNKYQARVAEKTKEKENLGKDGKELEGQLEVQEKGANFVDTGEGFLEIALVITSITLLSGLRKFWYLGLGLG